MELPWQLVGEAVWCDCITNATHGRHEEVAAIEFVRIISRRRNEGNIMNKRGMERALGEVHRMNLQVYVLKGPGGTASGESHMTPLKAAELNLNLYQRYASDKAAVSKGAGPWIWELKK